MNGNVGKLTCPNFAKLPSTELLHQLNLATSNFQVLEWNNFGFFGARLGQLVAETVSAFCRKKPM